MEEMGFSALRISLYCYQMRSVFQAPWMRMGARQCQRCRARAAPQRGEAAQPLGGVPLSHLHVHDVGVGLHHAVAHVQRGLKTDLGLLDGHHGFFQAHRGVL